MSIHIPWPEISQFRNAIKEVQTRASYKGTDLSGAPIYETPESYPIISFEGTVKLHGTNSSIVISKDELYCQSKETIITPENDNAGFAKYVKENEDIFRAMLHEVLGKTTISCVYGEWAGRGVNKGCAIHQLDKAFYIFGLKIISGDTHIWGNARGLGRGLEDYGIFNVRDFQTWNMEIDFNHPELSQNRLTDITTEVGNLCPIGKARGVEGIGEGVVWTGTWGDKIFRFKVKDPRHSVSKVKTLAPVDVERIDSINEFVEYAVTQNRFDQGISAVFGDSPINIKLMGDVLRWVSNDINKEESDVLASNNLTMKDVGKALSDKARGMFMVLWNAV